MGAPSYTQVTFRIRNDNGSESAATWRQNQGDDDSIDVDTNFRVRFLIDETNNKTWTNNTWNVYYQLNSGGYNIVTGSTPVQLATSSYYTDGDDCVSRLTGGGGAFLSDNNGMIDTSAGAVNSSAASGNFFEMEICLLIDSAQVSNGDTINLRVYLGSGALDVYTDTPVITVVEESVVNLTGAGGIASAEAFGTGTVSQAAKAISGAGAIATAEAFGTAVVSIPVNLTGAGNISSAEAFGTASLTLANYPVIVGVTGNNEPTDTTPYTVAIPDGSNVVGRLLILFLTSDGTSQTFTLPTGWSRSASEGGTGLTSVVGFREIDGTEGFTGTGDTISVSNSPDGEQAAWTVFLISNWDSAESPESSIDSGTGTSIDPVAFAPSWGSADNLWISSVSLNGLSATTPRITVYPTDYGGTRSDISTGGNGVVLATCYRNRTTDSENPSAYTSDTSTDWRAIFIAVKGSGDKYIIGAGGIASAEAFGTGAVSQAAKSITGAGAIASAEAFGTAVVSIAVQLSGAGNIASAEAFGTGAVSQQPASLSGAGAIASVEAFGIAAVTVGQEFLTGAGNIASAEAFGTATITQAAKSITGAGAIASAEAFGTPVVGAAPIYVTDAGAIASVEAFGTAVITGADKNITGAGAIASVEAFDTNDVQLGLSAIAISSAEAFGTAVITGADGSLSDAGDIASAEAFGTAVVSGYVPPSIADVGDISSAEAFGVPWVYIIGSGWHDHDAGGREPNTVGTYEVLEVNNRENNQLIE